MLLDKRKMQIKRIIGLLVLLLVCSIVVVIILGFLLVYVLEQVSQIFMIDLFFKIILSFLLSSPLIVTIYLLGPGWKSEEKKKIAKILRFSQIFYFFCILIISNLFLFIEYFIRYNLLDFSYTVLGLTLIMFVLLIVLSAFVYALVLTNSNGFRGILIFLMIIYIICTVILVLEVG